MASNRGSVPDVPGLTRPWVAGDRARFFLPGGTQWIIALDAADVRELNENTVKEEDGVVLRVRVVPESLLADQSFTDILDLLKEAGGELSYEHLEHRWTERQKEHESGL